MEPVRIELRKLGRLGIPVIEVLFEDDLAGLAVIDLACAHGWIRPSVQLLPGFNEGLQEPLANDDEMEVALNLQAMVHRERFRLPIRLGPLRVSATFGRYNYPLLPELDDVYCSLGYRFFDQFEQPVTFNFDGGYLGITPKSDSQVVTPPLNWDIEPVDFPEEERL